MRLYRQLTNVGVLGASVLIALAAAEGVARILSGLGVVIEDTIVYPEVPYQSATVVSANPRLSWELDPDSPLVNAAGFRDRDYAVARSPGTFRIVVLGDSVTFGRGVALEDTFTKVLERSLNENSQGAAHYEVLNFGVGGYNTDQEVEFYRVKGRRYRPDLIVVTYVLNDPISVEKTLRFVKTTLEHRKRREEKRAESTREAAGSSLLSRSLLVRLVANRWERLRQRLDGQVPAFPRDLHGDPEQWLSVVSAFEELAAIAREDGTPAILVIFPLLVDFDDYPFVAIHERLAREARRNGLDVLDLYPHLRDQDAVSLRLVISDWTHPNARGHREIAGAFHAHLLETGLVGRAD